MSDEGLWGAKYNNKKGPFVIIVNVSTMLSVQRLLVFSVSVHAKICFNGCSCDSASYLAPVDGFVHQSLGLSALLGRDKHLAIDVLIL